jgi:ketosteroid isomerase-like protein
MTIDPLSRLRAYHDAINELDFSTIEAMFAADAIYDSGGLGGVVEGREAIMAGFRSYFDTYPDQVSHDSLVEPLDGLRVRSVWRLTATHSQTGAAFIRAGEEIVTFDGEGRILRVEVTDIAP